MKNWKEFKIDDLCEVGRGSSPRPIIDQRFFKDGNIPWIKIADATASGKYIYKTKEYVNTFGASFSRLLEPNSLILAASGTLGQVNFLGIKGCVHDGWLYLSNYKEELLDKEYLYYYLKTIGKEFDNVSYGAAIQNINTTILRNTKILIPEIDTQRRIAIILSSYDELLEVNNQRIKLIEESARELYKEWFVLMRFPGYKQAKFIKGVPESFGEIKYFMDFIKLNRGFDLPEDKIKEGQYPVVASTSIKAYHNQYKVKAPIITTGRSGSLGTVLYINQDGWPLNTALYVKDFKGNEPLYVFFTLKNIDFESFNSGAGVPSLNQNHLHKLKLWIANKELQFKFKDFVEPIFQQIDNLNQQNTQLRQIRDRLLPRLISGKLEVKEK